MKKNLSFVIMLLIIILPGMQVVSQISYGGYPAGLKNQLTVNGLNRIDLIAPNIEQIWAEDIAYEEQGGYLRIGRSVKVNADFNDYAESRVLKDGRLIKRLILHSPGAKALAVHFSDFWMPEGASLFIYSTQGDYILGEYNSNNNPVNGVFATEMIGGDELIIEYTAPQGLQEPVLFIEELAYIYRNTNLPGHKNVSGFGDADNCEVNINCSPEGNNWQDEKRGVARILLKEGIYYGWCTGSLINNTLQDFTPYFLTADHCGVNSTTSDYSQWVFYFNYEAISCSNPSTSPSYVSMTGCTKVANGGNQGTSGSDFRLLLFNTNVPLSYNVYFNGWDRASSASTGGVGIHHPAGDIKKISTYTSTLTTSSWNGSGYSSHWKVYWASTTNGHGVTEGGSSGSPLFNNQGLIVGTLTGGSSYCSSPNNPDYYGKFSYHWESNGSTAAVHLKEWLDPNNSGVTSLSGINQQVSINGLNAYYCVSDTFVALSGNPAGGTFTGNGVSGSVFNPSLAGTGIQTITYTTSMGSVNTTVNVLPLPIVDLGADVQINSGQNTLLNPGQGFQSYLWSTGATTQTILVNQAGGYSVTVSDTAGCQNSDQVLVSVLLSNAPWFYTNTGSNHTILVPNNIPITIDGVNISNGDYIGVFYDSLGTLACAGYLMWDGTTSAVTAWGAQPGVIDGFASGEEFKWKIFDSSEGIEYDAVASYNTVNFVNTNTYTVNGLSGLASLQASSPGPGWFYTNTGSNHTILIQNTIPITIDGVQIESGDFIGVFYDSLGTLACAGYTEWQNTNSAVTAWGAQTGVVDGLASGEDFKWKIWDASADTVYAATATYLLAGFSNQGQYAANGLSGLGSLIATTIQIQSIQIPQGWSIFSTYIVPTNPDMEVVLTPVYSSLIIVKSGNGNVYWPPYINGIGNFVLGEGYQINLSQAETIDIEGTAAIPENININVPGGWSIIGYLRQSPGALETVLGSILPYIIIVKDGSGNVYWPPFINQIGNLNPGQGYQINLTVPSILVYPQN